MKATLFQLASAVFLTLGVSIHLYLRPIILSTRGDEIIFHYFFFLLAAILLFFSFKHIKAEPEDWICQACNTKLKRNQINFGVCPKCGKKIKGFKGMKSLLT
jgi:hypothetical protein